VGHGWAGDHGANEVGRLIADLLTAAGLPDTPELRAQMRDAARVELARQRLLNFTKFTYPRYVADPAHALIASTLDRVVAGDITRLMVFAPPQHGKSELVSVRLPAFWLAHHPHSPVILSSYAASLAHSKSRHARDLVESSEYTALFPEIHTDPDKRAVNHWELAAPHQGGLVAAGVGGPITGHGAALGIIDDPFENWEQAQSQVIREKVWEWWRGTFRTRVWEDGAIILIMTRWHEDDLAGRLLAEQGDRWTVLRLPALAETQADRDQRNKKMGLAEGESDPLGREPGEALCPSRFSVAALTGIRADVGSLVWACEYQGAPTQPEGNRFKRAWFPIVDAAPARAKRGRYWDLAATEGGGKRTAGVQMAVAGRDIYIEDVVVGQWASGRRNETMRQTAELDAQRLGHKIPTWVEQEPGSSGVDAIKAIIAFMAGFPIHADRPTGNKDVRLEPFAAQAEAGNVRLVRGKWNAAYIEEMCAVPNGKFRDQADATAGAYARLVRGGWSRGPGK